MKSLTAVAVITAIGIQAPEVACTAVVILTFVDIFTCGIIR